MTKLKGKKRKTLSIKTYAFIVIIVVLSCIIVYFTFRSSSILRSGGQSTLSSNTKTKSDMDNKSPSNDPSPGLEAASEGLQKDEDIVASKKMGDGEKVLHRDSMVKAADPNSPLQIDALLGQLTSDDWQERGMAAENLTRIGIPAVDPLRRLLEDKSTPLIALPDIIKTLGDIADPRAAPELGMMTNHNNAYIRRCATTALGAIADQESIPVFLKMISDSDIDVRALAIDSLALIASRNDNEVVQRICQIISTPNEHELVRSSAIKALGKIGEAQAVTPLSSILQGKYDLTLKNLSVTSLGEIGDPSALGPLKAHRDNLLSHEPTDPIFHEIWMESLQLTNTAIEKISLANK